jgi:hypothetical protein
VWAYALASVLVGGAVVFAVLAAIDTAAGPGLDGAPKHDRPQMVVVSAAKHSGFVLALSVVGFGGRELAPFGEGDRDVLVVAALFDG